MNVPLRAYTANGFTTSSAWPATFAVIGAVFLSRVWLILIAGSDVPFWDQWDGEALAIYKPFLEGALRFVDLFRHHNEHRIVFTHLLNLALLKLNGQWDPLVQMIAGSAIHSLTAGIVTAFLLRLAHSRVERIALLFAILAVFCLPFGWQNTLWAFQSSFYFSILFSLTALGFLSLGRDRATVWIAGIGFALAAMVAVGASSAIGLALIFLGCVRLRDNAAHRRDVVLIATGALILAFATLSTPMVPGHLPYRAHTLMQFVRPFLGSLSWPFTLNPALVLVTNAPLIVLVSLRLLRRIERDSLQDVSILLGAWAAAIGAGFAYYRGGIEIGSLVPASRYLDYLCFLILANALAAIGFVREASGVRRRRLLAAGSLWGVFMAAGLVAFTAQGWASIIRPRIENPNFRTRVVTLLQRTGDPKLIENYPINVHPMPNVAVLKEALDDPNIASILPPSIHPGIALEFAAETDAVFIKGGFPEPGPPPGNYPMRTSFSGNGTQRTGKTISEPFTVNGGGIELTFAGVLTKGGGSVSLVSGGSGSAIRFLSTEDTLDGWRTIRKRVSAGIYRLEAKSDTPEGWFAFSLPRPMGPLSLVVRKMQPHATWFLVVASVAGLAALVLAFPRHAQPETAPGATHGRQA